ncbi:glycoside hydrolase family 13 protein [Psychrosphaera sp. 1_MG-2023]|nr:glycoside hydrolase family 13 protein [Psychrosphaera sp. 1_MG-2023]MDO6717846.1 glycoside hydrolase family 13 protein [Psychrosphaera sp. 1_MG-2023]
MTYATQSETELNQILTNREKDWRIGAVVYQVLVDRFAPSSQLENKCGLYPEPKVLKRWNETPKHGHYLEQHKLWSHEIEFWGGDFESLTDKLDYIVQLGVDVLYLNPVHEAYTNHKYDSLDFKNISPEFGSKSDVKMLIDAVHQKGMKIVLDGVFNHMGQNAPVFQEAQDKPDSIYRDWFCFSDEYEVGYRSWDNATNLPELNLENEAVRSYVYLDDDSVVKSYLTDGVDGWRLDVAHDIGFNYLAELTYEAHKHKPGSLIIGEVWSYPQQWLGSVDGIMNLTMRHLIIQSVLGAIPANLANKQLNQMVVDSNYEGLLKSWVLLDNHDTARLATLVPDIAQRKLAMALQFCVPGSPNLYYGSELGMIGGDDPEMRAPMCWDKVTKDNEMLLWTLKLVATRKQNRALRIGEFKTVHSSDLIAFLRYTDKVEDACIIVVNPKNESVKEQLMIPYSKLMNMGNMVELLGMYPAQLRISASYLAVEMAPLSIAIFKPNTAPTNGYTTYKRVV